MIDWMPELSEGTGPSYRRLADAIRTAIERHELRPGDKLPPHRFMADRLSVTPGTVSRGYNLAAQWGLVTAHVGRGTVVNEPYRKGATLVIGEDRSPVDFGLLFPAPLEDRALREAAFKRTFANLGDELLQRSVSGYAPELGYATHRAVAARWLKAQNVSATAEEVIVTHGAQDAFLLILIATVKPGEAVLVEEIPYLGIKHLCALLRLNSEAVKLDAEGMIPDDLEDKARRSGAHTVILTPNLQNPTGARMSENRRRRIVDLARELDLRIIEDAAFDALLDTAPPALVNLAPERTFHIASFSKYVMPTMRVAFAKVPTRYRSLLESTRHSLSISGSSYQAEVLSRWIESGIAADLCHWQRGEMQRRWRLAVAILKGLVPEEALPAPFIWLTLPSPWRAFDFIGHARQKQVLILEADQFVMGRHTAPHAVRIALTSAKSVGIVEQGLEVLRQILEEGPRPVLVSFR